MIIFENFSVEDHGKVIIHPLNLTIKTPFSYGVIGHSGSGKSTLAKALSMLLPAHLEQKGKILYEGQNLLTLKEKQKRALRKTELKYLVQEPFFALNPYLKIRTQLKEVFEHKVSDEVLLSKLLDVQLDEKRILDAYPHELSGGQRQRIALLQALILEPNVLIADEPTTALDPIVEKQILSLITRYKHTHNSSLFLVSHDLFAISEMTDVTLVFHEGRLVETIESEFLLKEAKHPYTQALIESLILEDPYQKPDHNHRLLGDLHDSVHP